MLESPAYKLTNPAKGASKLSKIANPNFKVRGVKAQADMQVIKNTRMLSPELRTFNDRCRANTSEKTAHTQDYPVYELTKLVKGGLENLQHTH